MTGEQVVLVGLDGLGWEAIGDWVEDGTLPTLRSLREEGTGTTLESTHPPWTPCAWPSLLSGRNPGKHGVFDFFERDGYEKRLIDRGSVDAPYVHEVADAEGFVPLVVNYPVTQPAVQLDSGALIPGYLATEDAAFHPPELRDAYEDEYGPYRLYPDYDAEEEAVESYVEVARCRRDACRLLDERYDWDLLAVQFQVTDSVFHALDDPEKRREVLATVDEYVADIIDLADDDATVIVASDHGMGDYDWTFYVNSWLAENGYAETTTGETDYFPQLKSELKGQNRGDGSDESTPSREVRLLKAGVDALSAVGISPRRVHRGLEAVGLGRAVESLLPDEALLELQNEVVDHPNSVAFQTLFNSLGVDLNVAGREPAGVVPASEYESVRNRLMSDLEAVRDPDGKPVFESVQPREEVYSGRNLDEAPDVVLTPRDYRYDVSGTLVDTFRRNRHQNHRPAGLLVANRELAVDSDETPSIYDVAPTVAAALGLPVDSGTDGRVLGPFSAAETADWDDLAGRYRAGNSADETGDGSSRTGDETSETGGPGDDSEETGDVESRLADLGYME